LKAGSPPARPAAGAEAGLWRRFAALSYESLLAVALVFVASFALAPWVSPEASRTHAIDVPGPGGRIVSFIALVALGALFFGFCWSNGRRTLPMKTWRLALVDASGAPASPRRALVRYAAAWIGPALAVGAYALLATHGLGALAWPMVALNWLAAFVDPDRRFLHDRVAGTRLVTS